MQNKSLNKLSLFVGVVQSVAIGLLAALTFFTFGNRLPFLSGLGFNFFAITSGSMEPAIPTGSMIFTQKFAVEDLKAGDIITFQKAVGDEQSIVTHRISEIKKEESTRIVGEGEQKQETKVIDYDFITKGDANQTPDSEPVKAGEIIGLYKWNVPKVGFLTSFVQTQYGFVLLVVLPAAILVVWEVTSLFLHFKQELKIKSQAEIEKLKEQLAQHEKNRS